MMLKEPRKRKHTFWIAIYSVLLEKKKKKLLLGGGGGTLLMKNCFFFFCYSDLDGVCGLQLKLGVLRERVNVGCCEKGEKGVKYHSGTS